MSNVAIKLVAITGVVGLGVLMFMQAQKGIQSGNIENQMSQLDVLESSPETGDASESETTDEQNDSEAGKLKIPRDAVPAELSEMAALNANPIDSQTEPPPFAPNRISSASKIRLTAGTSEPAPEKEATSEFEPADANAFNPEMKGLDFRETPASNDDTPDLSENPFATVPTEQKTASSDQKIVPAPTLETEFGAGPQFGPAMPAEQTPATVENKTAVPARELLVSEEDPFQQKPGLDQPALSPTPELPDEKPNTESLPFPESDSPGSKLEAEAEPFELKTPSLPATPEVESDPFMIEPKTAPPKETIPETPVPMPEVEPDFNPFGNENTRESETPEAAPAMELNLPEPNQPDPAKSAAPEPNPFSNSPVTVTPEPEPAPMEISPRAKAMPAQQESPDVVVIKKRKEEPAEEPSLFSMEGKSADSDTSAPQPIEISPAAEPKPLNLVEGNEPAPQEPKKLSLQQRTQSPKMTIQKMAPPEAILGQPFIYHVIVKNSGTTSAQNVTVEDRIPQGAKLTGTIPRAEKINDRIIWRLGAMGPGTEKKISIRVIPEKAGQIGSVATVNFVTEVASETKITSPKLAIKSDSPQAVKPGEITVVNYTITNSGTGDAKNVYIRSIIPPQFTHPGGDDLEYNVGVIPAGQTKQIQLKLKAIKPGAGKNISSVMGDGNLKAETEVPLKVIGNGEQFLLTRKGPKNRYLGRSGSFENTITNNTEKPIQNISVFESVPPGMKFISATANGQFDTVRNVVQWDITSLGAGEQRSLSVELEPIQVGKVISTVQVVTDNNTKHSANLQSEVTVIGQPLLKVETSELSGPLEVGEKMAMQIQLVNQGSASATNVEFRVKIPDELVFLSAKGPVRYKQAGSYIIFEPAQELPAKQALNFELSFAAKNKGDARVLVSVQSKQMQKPLNQEEAIPVLDKLQ